MDPFMVIGGVLTVIMSINAFFLKGVYSDMQFIKIELAKLLMDHDNDKKVIATNSNEIKTLEDSVISLRERIHSLEGAQSQMLKFIEEVEGKKWH